MPARKTQKWHGRRALLNLTGQHSTGAIVAEIEDTHRAELHNWTKHPEANFHIADCDRSIAFDFDFGTPEERDNALYKIDTLIDVLGEFRRGLVVEQERFVKRYGSRP